MTSGDLQVDALVILSKELYKKQNMVMTSGDMQANALCPSE